MTKRTLFFITLLTVFTCRAYVFNTHAYHLADEGELAVENIIYGGLTAKDFVKNRFQG